MANAVVAPGFREVPSRNYTDRSLRIGPSEVDRVGSGFGGNVQLFVSDVETLSKKFPGECTEVIESLLVEAIPSDPHIPSYPNIAEVLIALAELHSKREERASRRRQGKAVSTSEAFRMTRAIVVAADKPSEDSENDEEESEDASCFEDAGSSLTKSAYSAAGSRQGLHDIEEDSLPEMDIDRPIILSGWNNHRIANHSKMVVPTPRHRVWPCRQWDVTTVGLATNSSKRSRSTTSLTRRHEGGQPKRARLLSIDAENAGDASSVSTEHDNSPQLIPLRALLLQDFPDEMEDGDYIYQSASEDFESDLESDGSVVHATSDDEAAKCLPRASAVSSRRSLTTSTSRIRTRAQRKAAAGCQDDNLNVGVRLTRAMLVPSFYSLH